MTQTTYPHSTNLLPNNYNVVMLVFNQEPLEEYDIAFQDDLQKEILLKN